jgi:hypothetical protein
MLWGHKAPLCPSLPDALVADQHPQTHKRPPRRVLAAESLHYRARPSCRKRTKPNLGSSDPWAVKLLRLFYMRGPNTDPTKHKGHEPFRVRDLMPLSL